MMADKEQQESLLNFHLKHIISTSTTIATATTTTTITTTTTRWRRGVAVERRTRDREVVGSSLDRALRRKNSGQVSHT